MFAVVEIGGHQYKVIPNEKIEVEKLEAEAGKTLTLDKVLLVAEENGKNTKIGQPYVEGATVEVKVVEQGKGPKIIIQKFRPKKRYARRTGHRQPYTLLEITAIKA